jgi:hypothetical protein
MTSFILFVLFVLVVCFCVLTECSSSSGSSGSSGSDVSGSDGSAVESTESEVPRAIDSEAPVSLSNDSAPTVDPVNARTVGIRSTVMRGPLLRHLWCSACECVADLQLSVYVKEPRQRVQLGSRLVSEVCCEFSLFALTNRQPDQKDDANKYKYKDYWRSTVGANEAIERVCESLLTKSESKHPFRLIRSASGEHEWIAGAKETHPANHSVVDLGRVKHQLSEWCIHITEDLEEKFIKGFIAGVQSRDFRTDLCVKELRACTELPPAAPANEKTEL